MQEGICGISGLEAWLDDRMALWIQISSQLVIHMRVTCLRSWG